MAASADDVFDLAAAVFGEARGESRKGREAVAHTILNRSRAAEVGIGPTVYGRAKFTAVGPKDRNRAKIAEVARKNTSAWREAMSVAADVMSGKVPDPTEGATHYFATSSTALLIGNA